MEKLIIKSITKNEKVKDRYTVYFEDVSYLIIAPHEVNHKKLKLDEKEVSDEEAVKLMVKHPDLMQRPIVEKGNKAILARPAERLKEIL